MYIYRRRSGERNPGFVTDLGHRFLRCRKLAHAPNSVPDYRQLSGIDLQRHPCQELPTTLVAWRRPYQPSFRAPIYRIIPAKVALTANSRCVAQPKSHSLFATVIHCKRSGIIVCVRLVDWAIGLGIFGFLVLSCGRSNRRRS